MSAGYDKTWDLFMAASLSDDDLGYPDEVEFIPGDEEWADEVLWRNLTEGHPTVLVSEDAELLLLPRPRSLIDRLRGHVVVNVAHRAPTDTPRPTRLRAGWVAIPCARCASWRTRSQQAIPPHIYERHSALRRAPQGARAGP
jgi:hypothetical protein